VGKRVKILLIHSGHSHSTKEVSVGLQRGLEANGVDVVPWELDKVQKVLHSLRHAGELVGFIPEDEREQMSRTITNLASADAVTLALMHDVDAVVVVYGLLFPAARVVALKKLGVPVVCFGTEAPYIRKELEAAPFYDVWFTNERRSVDLFRAYGANAYYLPTAYDPTCHAPGPAKPEYRADAVFIGGAYPERKRMLDGAQWDGIDLRWLGTLKESNDPFAGIVPNSEAIEWYRSSTISLNFHRTTGDFWQGEQIDPSMAESLGPRAYEVPACGGFLLTDWRPEVDDVFGDSAAVFERGNPDDLIKQVKYWLNHPDQREATARAQHEAVRPHSYVARAAKLLEIIA
jgi:spore maturation protein CgeB